MDPDKAGPILLGAVIGVLAFVTYTTWEHRARLTALESGVVQTHNCYLHILEDERHELATDDRNANADAARESGVR